MARMLYINNQYVLIQERLSSSPAHYHREHMHLKITHYLFTKKERARKKENSSFFLKPSTQNEVIYIYLYLYTFFVYHLFSVSLSKRGSAHREGPLAIWTTLALAWRGSLHHGGVGTHYLTSFTFGILTK